MAKKFNLLRILCVICVCKAVITKGRKLEESSSDTEFIRTSCEATSYPDLCFQSLSSYASEINKRPHQLAETALTVSLDDARSAKVYISQMINYEGITKRQHEAVLDCAEEMSDTVDRLNMSLKELKNLGEGQSDQDFWFCLNDVQTWTSAALTDENTCLDGFGGKAMDGDLKSLIKTHVLRVAQETSNALALINEFASKH